MTRLIALLSLALAGPAMAQSDAPSLTVVETEEWGPIIADGDGRAVYTFETNLRGGDGQQPLESCNETCLEDWPLVAVEGEPTVGEGLDPELVAVLDWQGVPVLVYDSQPLFYYAQDVLEQEPQGQANHSYGGWWYLLDPTGMHIVSDIAPDPNDPAIAAEDPADE